MSLFKHALRIKIANRTLPLVLGLARVRAPGCHLWRSKAGMGWKRYHPPGLWQGLVEDSDLLGRDIARAEAFLPPGNLALVYALYRRQSLWLELRRKLYLMLYCFERIGLGIKEQ
jgi:hypothetical protein